ncbi:M48 family metalloprotease [Actinomadura sp. DSM 109109]|nr:M48 family metalloprotease [Actinomadura lepetitiana]
MPADEPARRHLPPGQPQGTPSGRAGLAIALVVAAEGGVVGAAAIGAWSVSLWGAVAVIAVWALLLLAPLTASRSYGYREPDEAERARLEHAWRYVQQHAGVSGYRLVVVESDGLNACRPSARTVAVTSDSARSLPSGQLVAALAHELGHLQGWRAVPAFVHAQVTLPHRTFRWVLRTVWSPIGPMWKRAVEWHRPIGFLGVLLLAVAASAVTLLVVVPAALSSAAFLAARLLSAGGEARADAAAVRMGFGADLVAAVEHRIENQPDGLPLPLVRRAQALRRRLG